MKIKQSTDLSGVTITRVKPGTARGVVGQRMKATGGSRLPPEAPRISARFDAAVRVFETTGSVAKAMQTLKSAKGVK